MICAASVRSGMPLTHCSSQLCTITADCPSAADCSFDTHQQRHELTSVIVIHKDDVEKFLNMIGDVKDYALGLEAYALLCAFSVCIDLYRMYRCTELPLLT
jgi:hypothetical protein